MTNTTVAHTTTEISLSKLHPSPDSARRIGTGLGIEALAASIAAHGLLQSLVVRPLLDGHGKATGKYEVVAGGRCLAALKLLARGKRLPKTMSVPCRVLDGEGVDGAEASLAENPCGSTCTVPTRWKRSRPCTAVRQRREPAKVRAWMPCAGPRRAGASCAGHRGLCEPRHQQPLRPCQAQRQLLAVPAGMRLASRAKVRKR